MAACGATVLTASCLLVLAGSSCAGPWSDQSESFMSKYARELMRSIVETEISDDFCEELDEALRCGVSGNPGVTIVVKKSADIYINGRKNVDGVLDKIRSGCLNPDKQK